jgi:hypothetical protein
MPSTSKSQQRLFALVRQYQKGKLKNPPAKIKKVTKHISPTDATHFAETKTMNLPEHVKQSSALDYLRAFQHRDPEQFEKEYSTKKHMNKQAFERGFIKAAIYNKVHPLTAIQLLKRAAASPEELLAGAIPSGAIGALGSGLAGGLGGYALGHDKDPEKDHSTRDAILGGLAGAGIGGVGGGYMGANNTFKAGLKPDIAAQEASLNAPGNILNNWMHPEQLAAAKAKLDQVKNMSLMNILLQGGMQGAKHHQ